MNINNKRELTTSVTKNKHAISRSRSRRRAMFGCGGVAPLFHTNTQSDMSVFNNNDAIDAANARAARLDPCNIGASLLLLLRGSRCLVDRLRSRELPVSPS